VTNMTRHGRSNWANQKGDRSTASRRDAQPQAKSSNAYASLGNMEYNGESYVSDSTKAAPYCNRSLTPFVSVAIAELLSQPLSALRHQDARR
jgi:hypothetical protein